MTRKSYITVTDQFCGAGGSSIGAVAAGAELRLALNHWSLAIETHNSNFPDAAHDCTDISACDPRRYPSTDILITSPECTNHSLAKGKRKLSLSSQEWKEAREQYTNPHYGIGELMSRKVLECMGYTTCMEDAPQDKWDDWVYFWGLFADMVRGKVAPYFEVTTDPKGKKKGRK